MDWLRKKTANFEKRNQTTHSWYSQSVPSGSFLDSRAASQPSTSRTLLPKKSFSTNSSPISCNGPARSESVTSPYSYDGGVFTSRSPKRDFFVIHPDWVSEETSIEKMSIKEKKMRSMSWPRRRCKSAPPPKFRNPITWE
ncbi:hypothetical protein SNE40_004922 [Patella caerulea]|uniref:Uncharacterized protein n=1 Tax=Patella caerulea TaxID=87958 RepID=A0AAN8K6G9_PATCE